MKTRAAVLLALFGVFRFVAAAEVSTVPTPSQFLNVSVGADRQLADYHQIAAYFKELEAKTSRVRLQNLGKTTLGEDMLMAVISSEDNLAKLDAIKATAKKLSDPRGLSDTDVDTLVKSGKVVLLVTCNIHASEIGSTQMAMEWAHALATAEDAETKRRLSNVVLLLVPSLNPDGQIMEVDWYRKNLGTKYEGSRLPWLYHHYTGHDNNRDWVMLTQKETKAMSRAIYKEWFPQIFLDEHQMGSVGPRIFVPPFSEPVAADIHPLVWREGNLIGANMALRLEQAGKSGVIYGYSYDAYWPGGTMNTSWWKNITGLLTEVASARLATPIQIAPNELNGGRKGLIGYEAQSNFPNPWPGGTWRLRDILDYERIASDAILETCADRREDVLRDMVTRAKAAITAGGKDGYRIPGSQRDAASARALVELMSEHGVDLRVDAKGDTWIPLSQPYGTFASAMLDTQRYPEVRLVPGKDIVRPYDVATWSLPLMMGVSVNRAAVPADLKVAQSIPAFQPSDGSIAKARAEQEKLRPPRIGLYKPWAASMDEGWTRFILEQHGFKSTALDNKTIRAGKLTERLDVIVLPDVEKETIATGKPKREEGEMKYFAELPPEYAGGLEKEGAKALKEFVENGGTLVAMAASTTYVIDEFNVPVRNTLAKAKSDDFQCPGSLLWVNVDTKHPVGWGLPEKAAIFVDKPIAFETTPPGAEMERRVLATYPSDQHDILASGWIHNADRLARQAAAVAMTYGKGRIVLLGFRPQFRAQMVGTFRFLFNSLYWSVMK